MIARINSLAWLPPERAVACLSEVLGAASRTKDLDALARDAGFRKFLDRIGGRLFGYSATDAYLLLAALSKVPAVSPELVGQCFDQICDEFEDLSDAQVGRLCLVLARFRFTCPRVESSLPRLLRCRVPQLDPTNICRVIVGVDRLRLESDPLFDTLQEAVIPRRDALSPEQLSSSTLSMAHLSICSEEFVAGSLTRLGRCAGKLPPKHLGEAMLSFASFGATSAALTLSWNSLQHRAAVIAHFCDHESSLNILRALCALSCFPRDTVLHLLRNIARVPRSSLSEADDNSVHQVALSLTHEQAAADSRAQAQADDVLWDSVYQPTIVVGEVQETANGVVADAISELATSQGWTVVPGVTICDFYHIDLELRSPGGSSLLVHLDHTAHPLLSEPVDIFQRLRHRHLHLLGYHIWWVKLRAWSLKEASRYFESVAHSFLKQ